MDEEKDQGIVALLWHFWVSHETLVYDQISFQASFLVIDEAHEVFAEVDTVADLVAKVIIQGHCI